MAMDAELIIERLMQPGYCKYKMAINNEVALDQNFEDMKNLAIEQQQCFYELLYDCMTYKPDERKYLKQNIGYALYGPPENNENINATESNVCCNTENQSEDADITNTIDYSEKAKTLINKIYDKICEYTIGTDDNEPIYFAIIYNVVVCTTPKKSEDDKGFAAIPIPVFKMWRKKKPKGEEEKTGKEETEKLMKTDEEYEIWYIDTTGRIYKDWTDYKTKNNLFKCTMVLPKDGLYQPDPSYPITEDYSTVWLEIMDSPACSLASWVCNGGDIASIVTGAGALAVGAASLFTPLAPAVLIAGFAASGVTTVWATVRSTQQLIDRSIHEESINPLDQEAFPQWLTITGSVFGLGAMGGAAFISTAVSRGMTVNTAARLAFNTVQGGNLFLNGVGIVYQGYCMVDRYRTDDTISLFDVVSLATHLMFFAGTVINIQFAGDIIQNDQNRIINDYKKTLSKRLRKKYNRVSRRVAENNPCKMSENAEVIRYINNRNQLLISETNTSAGIKRSLQSNDQITENPRPNIIIQTIENNILVVNGIHLLDAVEFVIQLIRSDMPTDSNQDNTSDSQNYDTGDFDIIRQLWSALNNLLSLNNWGDCNSPINMDEFIPLLREMDSLNVGPDLLQKIFSISMRLIQRSRSPKEFLFKTMRLVWLYCKTNLKQWGIRTFLRMKSIAGFNILRMIITALFEAKKLDNLYLAFEKKLEYWLTS